MWKHKSPLNLLRLRTVTIKLVEKITRVSQVGANASGVTNSACAENKSACLGEPIMILAH